MTEQEWEELRRKFPTLDEALCEVSRLGNIIGEAYQVLGVLAYYTKTGSHPDVVAAMDRLAYQDDGPSLLPWPKTTDGLETS